MITVAPREKEMDLVLAYRLYQRMMKYPQLVKEMRSIFLSALEERRIVDGESLRMEARAKLA
ncbi:MAG: hypothetical protein JRJ29_12380, partial [Deltaproteobacteria bacterium]|nr:hypothetical protein [Deltaproteobacteria bacterium]